MAKEIMIVFVYDTKVAEDQENDTFDGIVYFHPNWVPQQQRTALCGQVIGTAHCLKSIFSCPRIICLQTGKFYICDFMRYILVIGTDKNINDWVLEYRANLLTSLLTFYHKDLEVMTEIYSSQENFMTKLYYVLETYLNLLIYGHGGNIFNNIISLQLPKSASCVFLEAVQILRSCQRVDHVLGGALLYHNKIVTTQLNSDSTKWLVLSNPYHLKSSAEVVKTDFDLPIGTKLLQVYIKEDEYNRLKKESSILRSAQQCLANAQFKANPIKEPVLMKMKRDQSLLFTAVPEEGGDPIALNLSKPMPTKIQNRPKFLNLKSKTTDAKTEVKLETKQVAGTPFLGSTSVCSTPMTDLNKVIHQNLMSICVNPKENNETSSEAVDLVKIGETEKSDSVHSLLSAVSDVGNVQEKGIKKLKKKLKKSSSCSDMSQVQEDDSKNGTKVSRKSITDPTFPVFSSNGFPMSEYAYNQYICNADIFNLTPEKIKYNNEDWRSFQDFDRNLEGESAKKEEIKAEIKSEFVNRRKSLELRKSLTLPLKPSESQNVSSLRQNSILTPLMTKLNMLATEEKSSGFCSVEATPVDYKDMKSAMKKSYSFLKSENKLQSDDGQKLKPVVLFICGQQDMVVHLFLEQEAITTLNCINRIYENCINYMGRLDKQIRQCLEIHPGGSSQNDNSDAYSYLCMNAHWDTVQKVGAWGSCELNSISHMHRDFVSKRHLTEMIIRDDICVIYGNNYGATEVFYNQATSANAGLPTPADPMGIIALKAKRRLERDHAIILH